MIIIGSWITHPLVLIITVILSLFAGRIDLTFLNFFGWLFLNLIFGKYSYLYKLWKIKKSVSKKKSNELLKRKKSVSEIKELLPGFNTEGLTTKQLEELKKTNEEISELTEFAATLFAKKNNNDMKLALGKMLNNEVYYIQKDDFMSGWGGYKDSFVIADMLLYRVGTFILMDVVDKGAEFDVFINKGKHKEGIYIQLWSGGGGIIGRPKK